MSKKPMVWKGTRRIPAPIDVCDDCGKTRYLVFGTKKAMICEECFNAREERWKKATT